MTETLEQQIRTFIEDLRLGKVEHAPKILFNRIYQYCDYLLIRNVQLEATIDSLRGKLSNPTEPSSV